jgi:hypothetical protein
MKLKTAMNIQAELEAESDIFYLGRSCIFGYYFAMHIFNVYAYNN